MTLGYKRAKNYLSGLLERHGKPVLSERLRPKPENQLTHVPGGKNASLKAVHYRWTSLGLEEGLKDQLLDDWSIRHLDSYARNIEHLIGTVKVPVGLAGPLRVNGLFAQGDYYVPLATSEASLVASYSRGACLITEAGGASVALVSEGVSRAPMFAFDDLQKLGEFVHWALSRIEDIAAVANATSRFGRLVDVELSVQGTNVFFLFIYATGDAAGQNMVTFATAAALDWILEHSPVNPRAAYEESNFSGDKKASTQSFQRVRGKKVIAEATLPAELVKRRLHVEPSRVLDCARIGSLGAVMSGTIGTQGHFANGLAALFLACGQDVACVAEAAIGITDIEPTETGGIHISVTLPNLIVGTVGGGTKLPSQTACLDLLGVRGDGGARPFAEIAAALCLAGELSLIGAIAAGEFADAHSRLARGKRLRRGP